MYEGAAARAQCAAKSNALLDIPATLNPVGARHPNADRHLPWNGSADGIKDRQWKTHAVFQRATVSIAALIGQRRQELVQQIAVRRVDFYGVNAKAVRALGRGCKGFKHTLQTCIVQCLWRGLVRAVSGGRRCKGLPAALVNGNQSSTFPRHMTGGFAARVVDLDTNGYGRVFTHSRQHFFKRGFGGIRPQTQVAMRDASFWLDRRRLNDQQACA